MSARFKGHSREVEQLLIDFTTWAPSADKVHALVLVGSCARSQARMGSDVELAVLCDSAEGYLGWGRVLSASPGSRLIRSATRGPVQKRRSGLTSRIHFEFGFAPLSKARVPLDADARRVLGDGHRILHGPHDQLAGAVGAPLAVNATFGSCAAPCRG